MSPGMTVVPWQSTTTSAAAADVLEAAPMATISPLSTRMASASRRGADSTPVARAPMLRRPSVATGSVLPEAAVDGGLGRRPIVGLEHPGVHHGLRGRVEHLVLELAAAELRADKVPDELDELDPVARVRHARPVVALRVCPGLPAREARLGRGHGLEGSARQLAERPHHVHDEPALEAHPGIDVLGVRARYAVHHQGGALGRLDKRIEARAERGDVAAEGGLGGRILLVAVELDELHGEPGYGFGLHREA